MNDNIKTLLICLATLVGTLAVVIAAFAIVVRYKTTARRRKIEQYGRESEARIDALLKKNFGDAAVFSGIYLPYLNTPDKHAEIDHLVITRSGVYVIEVKSHNGYIQSPDERNWWQTYNDKKIQFYNPIRQNNTHVKIVQEILKAEGQYNVPMYNIVVFTSHRVTFSKKHDNVIPTEGLVGYIRRVGKKNALSTSQVGRVRRAIAGKIVSGKDVARKHKRAIRNYK
ncbi:MAG: NERD domain-containing protein [Clostridia bacterium]|nr:NERD domain-containing protein [Clostridia bacterium]